MIRVLVAVYSPDNMASQRLELVDKIHKEIRKKRLSARHIFFNPISNQIHNAVISEKYKHLFLSWTNRMPNLNEILGSSGTMPILDTVHLWYISDFASINKEPENNCEKLDICSMEKMKSLLAADAKIRLVNNGYFIANKAPYGTKRIALETYRMDTCGKRRPVVHYRIEPGSTEHCEVVRLIFDLYGCRNMSMSKITHLLQAQEVSPPPGNKNWTMKIIDRILCDPVYIGSLRYKNFVRNNAIPPIVEEWLFYAVQSRRSMEKLRCSGVKVAKIFYEKDMDKNDVSEK